MRPAKGGRGHVRRIERNRQLAPGRFIAMVRLDQLRLGLHGEHAELQRLVGGSLAGGDPLGLHAIDAVGKLRQGVVHLDPLPRHQHAEIIRPHLRGQIVTGPVQRQFRIVEIDSRRGLGQPQLAAGDDRLTDGAALVAGGQPRIDVVGLIADVRVGIGAGLDHVAAGRFHVGGRLANERIAGHRDRLQLGERQRRLAGRGDRFGRGGDDVQVGKEGFDRAALFGRRGPRLDAAANATAAPRCPGSRWGFPAADDGPPAAEPRSGLRRRRAGIRSFARASCRAGSARHSGPSGETGPAAGGHHVGHHVPMVVVVVGSGARMGSGIVRAVSLHSPAKAAGSYPWGSRPGIRPGCQPGTACHTDNRPCMRTGVWQEQLAVRSSPSWQTSQSVVPIETETPVLRVLSGLTNVMIRRPAVITIVSFATMATCAATAEKGTEVSILADAGNLIEKRTGHAKTRPFSPRWKPAANGESDPIPRLAPGKDAIES